MRCQRCQGYMVVELIEEFLAGGAEPDSNCWRCLMCGDIIDAVIVAHRMSRTNARLGPKGFSGLRRETGKAPSGR